MYITATLTTYYLAPFPTLLTLSEMEYVTLCELGFGPDINACMGFTVLIASSYVDIYMHDMYLIHVYNCNVDYLLPSTISYLAYLE